MQARKLSGSRRFILEHHAHVLIGGVWRHRLPNWRDAAALILVMAVFALICTAVHQLAAPWVAASAPVISLSPAALPLYALRTTARMMVALVASLVFTLVYATLAAKSRRAEVVLIPLLDVLQSVPILGYLSFTVVFFVSLFPGSVLGLELAAIFAIFTSQAWNMAFSFYQSLKTIPHDLDEASRSFRSSGWQRFWRLEVPFAMPGLIWNMMMSMSGGWFFVVASEAISVGDVQYTLPGVGSYVARAIQDRDLAAVYWAIGAMTITILIYDQLLFRPMVAWADKFRFEQTAASIVPKSWVLDLFRRSRLLRAVEHPIGVGLHLAANLRLRWPSMPVHSMRGRLVGRLVDLAWYGGVLALVGYCVRSLVRFAGPVEGSAGRAISRRFSRESAVSTGRVPDRALPPGAQDLAQPADDPGYAVVHSI